MSFLTNHLGNEFSINNVIVGTNLNVRVIRGFARLDELALISSPDVYSQIKNEFGTQRELDRNHAKQVFDYAIQSADENPMVRPRAFPEVILNARDTSVLKIIDPNTGTEYEFNSNDDMVDNVFVASVTFLASEIEFNRTENPQISRVDGNHRLSKATEVVIDGDFDGDFPMVPFALFVGLTADQERSLFRDINGEQKKMETAHLATITLKLKQVPELLSTDSGRALWIAQKLSEEGQPFEDLVFFGGDKKAYKEIGRSVPPIRISTLKGAVQATLKDCRTLSKLAENFTTDSPTDDQLLDSASTYLALVSLYWHAVRFAFPEAWQDRTNFILLQSIGITGFSKLASVIIDEQIEKDSISQEDFNLVLSHVASKVDITKAAWSGFAGLAGAKRVYEKLYAASTDGLDATRLRQQLGLRNDRSALD
jgi:DGQHR domain-containing protein